MGLTEELATGMFAEQAGGANATTHAAAGRRRQQENSEAIITGPSAKFKDFKNAKVQNHCALDVFVGMVLLHRRTALLSVVMAPAPPPKLPPLPRASRSRLPPAPPPPPPPPAPRKR
jgi:hypothetical protein